MDLFSLENLMNLLVLLFLQAVLGFDNLLYISIESKRAPEHQQKSVRRNAIFIAIAARVILLFVMVNLLKAFEASFWEPSWEGVFEAEFNFSAVVFLIGGAFIMYTAVKEIGHMLTIEKLDSPVEDASPKSAKQVIAMLVVMNLVFSFDSILSALAITPVFPILALAIIGSGLAMLLLADRVSEFLERNRKYEVLGLFILLIVGVVLLGEGGEESHLRLFDYPVEAMSKTTFYFSIAVLVLVDVIQGRYKQKLAAQRKAGAKG